MKLPASADEFFFRPVSARGFGLMRVAWACVAAAFLLMQWKDVAYYYGDGGIITERTSALIMRSAYRFTILDWASSPGAVFALYLLMLGALLLVAFGVWPRLTTAVSVLLLFSFHERNQMVLTGGDTLLRNIGFLLVLAPGGGAAAATACWSWLRGGAVRRAGPEATMPIWPWRLLLWQMVVLYGTSLWYKLLGSTWIAGTAVEATFHHPVVARWPMLFMNTLMPVAGVADYLMLCWQAAWLLLLVPRSVMDRLLPVRIARIPLRRILILGGVVFHGGILLLLDAGVFPLAIFTAYLGLLREDDFSWLGALSLTPVFRSRTPGWPLIPPDPSAPRRPFQETKI